MAADHKSIEGSAKLDRLFNDLTKASLECNRWDFDVTLISYKLNKTEFLENISKLKEYVLELAKKTESELTTADNNVDWFKDDDIYSLYLVHKTIVLYFLELVYQYELLMIRKNNKHAILDLIRAVPTNDIAIYNYISSLFSKIDANGLKTTLINAHTILSLNALDDVSLINHLLRELITTYLAICTNRGYHATKSSIFTPNEETNYKTILKTSEAEITLSIKCINTLVWHKKTEINSRLFGRLYENLTNLLKINIVNNHLISALTVLFVNVTVRRFAGGTGGTISALLKLVNLEPIEAPSSQLDDNPISTPRNLTNTNHVYLIRGVLYYMLSTSNEGAFEFSEVLLACYQKLKQYLVDNANNNIFVLNYALMQAIQVYILFLPSDRCPQSTATTYKGGSYIHTLYDLAIILVNYLGNEVKSISQLAFMVYKKVIFALVKHDGDNFYKKANTTLAKSLKADKPLSNKTKYTVCNVMIKIVDVTTILKYEPYLMLHLMLNITNNNSAISALLLALLQNIMDYFTVRLNRQSRFDEFLPNAGHVDDRVLSIETEKEGPEIMLKCFVYPLLTCVIREYRVVNYEGKSVLLPVYRKTAANAKSPSNEEPADDDKRTEKELRFKYINEVMSKIFPNYYVDLVTILNGDSFDFYKCLPRYYQRVFENKTLDAKCFYYDDLNSFYILAVDNVRKYILSKISSKTADRGANGSPDERPSHKALGDDEVVERVSNGNVPIVRISDLSDHMIECLKNIIKSHKLIHVNDLTVNGVKRTGMLILTGNSAYHVDLESYLKRLYDTDDARLRISLLELVFHTNKVNKEVVTNEFAVFKYAMKYVVRLINAATTNNFIKIARLFVKRVAYNLNKQLAGDSNSGRGTARFLLVNVNAAVQALLSNLNLHYNEYRVELSLEVILAILEEFDSYRLLDNEYLTGSNGGVLFKLLDIYVFLKLNDPVYLYHNKKHQALLFKIIKLISLDRILRVHSGVIHSDEMKKAMARIKEVPRPSLLEIKKPEYEFRSSAYLNAVDCGRSLHDIFAEFYPKPRTLKRPAQRDFAKIPFYTLVICYTDYEACDSNGPLQTSGFLNFSHKLFSTYFCGSQNQWLNDIPKEGRLEIDKMTYKLYKLLLKTLMLISAYSLDKLYHYAHPKYCINDRKAVNDYIMYNTIGELTKNITIVVTILIKNGFKRMEKALNRTIFVLIYCILNCKVVHSNEIINNLLVLTLSYIKDTNTLYNYLLYLVSIVLNSGSGSENLRESEMINSVYYLKGASSKDIFRLNLRNLNLAINNRCEHISLLFISILKSLSSNKILYNYYVNNTINILVVALLKLYYKDYLYFGAAKNQKRISETNTKVVVIAYVLRYIYRCVNIKFINNCNILNTMRIALLLMGEDVDFVTKNALTLLFSTIATHNCNYFLYNYLNFANFFAGSKLLLHCFCHIVRQHGQYLDRHVIDMAKNPALEKNIYTKAHVTELPPDVCTSEHDDGPSGKEPNGYLSLVTEFSSPNCSKAYIKSIDIKQSKNLFVFKYYIAKLFTLKYDNTTLIKILSNLVHLESSGNIYTIIHIIKHINDRIQSGSVPRTPTSHDNKNDESVEKVINLLCKLIKMYNKRGNFAILILLTELYLKIVNDNFKIEYLDAKYRTIAEFCLRNDFISSHTLHFELYRSLFYHFINSVAVTGAGNQTHGPNKTILDAFTQLSKTMIASMYDLKYSLREKLSQLYLREFAKIDPKRLIATSFTVDGATISDAFSHTYIIIMHLLTDDAAAIRDNMAKLANCLDCKLYALPRANASSESLNSKVPICHDLTFGKEVRNELYNGFTPHENEYKLLRFITHVLPLRPSISIFEHIVSLQSCKRFDHGYNAVFSFEIFDTEESNIYKEHITYLKYGLVILIDDLIAEKHLIKTIAVSIKLAELLSDKLYWRSNLAPFAFAALYLRLFIAYNYREDAGVISRRINECCPDYLSPDYLESFSSDPTQLSELKDLIVENKRMFSCVNGFVYLHGQISDENPKLDNDHLLVLQRIIISM